MKSEPKIVKELLAMAQTWMSSVLSDFSNNCPNYYGKNNLDGPKASIWEPADTLWSTTE